MTRARAFPTVGQRIAAAIAASNEAGMNGVEVAIAVGITKGHLCVELTRLRRAGQVFSGGAMPLIRYFAQADWAEAFAPVALAELAVATAARLERKREQHRARRRRLSAERGPKKPRASPKPKAKPALVATQTPWRADHSKPASMPKPKVVQRIVVPENVKRTVAPVQRDTRFTAEGPVIDGFATMGVGRYLDEVPA